MTVTACIPYLRVHDGRAALAFYADAFGAEVVTRLDDPGDGRVGHAELRLADGVGFMLSDAYPELGILAPQGPGVTGAALHLHVDDCDGLVERARAAGATVLREPTTQFYGERTAALRDPFHHEWMVGQQVEDVDPAEMQRRWEAESA